MTSVSSQGLNSKAKVCTGMYRVVTKELLEVAGLRRMLTVVVVFFVTWGFMLPGGTSR